MIKCRATGRAGYSILELLIVVGIISILVFLQLGSMHRVLGKVKNTARAEAIRQDALGREADAVHEGPMRTEPATRQECIDAFRKTLHTGKEKMLVSEMLYVVTSGDEFQAYWHTMLNPENFYTPEYEGNTLVARDPDGKVFRLPALYGSHLDANAKHGTFPIAWDYLSSNLADNTSGEIGAEVLYSDGHMEFVGYPGKFPAVREVTELSRQFVVDLPKFDDPLY
jgi:Tfp pilus assembly protein PilE